MRIFEGHIVGSLKNLDHSLVFVYFHNTADFARAVIHAEFYDFFIGSVFYALQDYKRTVDFA